jgi:hypothetical protein
MLANTANTTMITTTTDETPLPEGGCSDAVLKAAQVVSVAYDDLTDDLKGQDIQQFLLTTQEMTQADEEEWRPQYDALENLRIMNKYHGEDLNIA